MKLVIYLTSGNSCIVSYPNHMNPLTFIDSKRASFGGMDGYYFGGECIKGEKSLGAFIPKDQVAYMKILED